MIAAAFVWVAVLGLCLGMWLERGVRKIERAYGRSCDPASVGRVLARVVARVATRDGSGR